VEEQAEAIRAENTSPIPTPGEIDPATMTVNLACDAGALKAFPDGRVGGYAILFSGPSEKDLTGDYFTPKTNIVWEGKESRPALYHHGFDPELGKRTLGDGWRLKFTDKVGCWVEEQLDLRDEYEKAIHMLAAKGKLGLSTGTAGHMVKRAPDGMLELWPIVEISYTPKPAEPRTAVRPLTGAVTPLKALILPEEEAAQHRPVARQAMSKDKTRYKSSVKGAQNMGLLERIQVLVPDLSPDQVEKISAVLDMMGMSASSEAPAAGETPAPVASPDTEGKDDETIKAIRNVLGEYLGEADPQAIPDYDFTAVDGAPDYAGKSFEDFAAEDPTDAIPDSVKAVATLKYGDMDKATRAVIGDLYGLDYELKMFQQHRAFGHFLRYGDRGLTGEAQTSLKMLLLLPAQIKAMVKSGITVAEVKTDLSEAIDSLGGYLVPEDIRLDLIERLPGLTVVRPVADVMTTNRDVMSRVKVTGGDDRHVGAMRVTWVGDTPTANQAVTNPTFGVEKTPIHIAKCTVRVPMALLEDTAYPLATKIGDWATTEFALDEDEQFLIGNGIAKPMGILPGGVNGNSLTRVASGSASTITADALLTARRTLPRQYRNGAMWVMNEATASIVDKLKDGQGRYLWADGLNTGEPDRLAGYPVATDEAMPDVASSAYPLIFANMRGYQIADRVGMSLTRDETTEAEADIVKYLFRRRLGGQVAMEWAFVVMQIAAS